MPVQRHRRFGPKGNSGATLEQDLAEVSHGKLAACRAGAGGRPAPIMAKRNSANWVFPTKGIRPCGHSRPSHVPKRC